MNVNFHTAGDFAAQSYSNIRQADYIHCINHFQTVSSCPIHSATAKCVMVTHFTYPKFINTKNAKKKSKTITTHKRRKDVRIQDMCLQLC